MSAQTFSSRWDRGKGCNASVCFSCAAACGATTTTFPRRLSSRSAVGCTGRAHDQKHRPLQRNQRGRANSVICTVDWRWSLNHLVSRFVFCIYVTKSQWKTIGWKRWDSHQQGPFTRTLHYSSATTKGMPVCKYKHEASSAPGRFGNFHSIAQLHVTLCVPTAQRPP